MAVNPLDEVMAIGELEKAKRQHRSFHRNRQLEDYNDHTGKAATCSLKTLITSKEQLKVVLLASVFYFLCLLAYTCLANLLIYVDFHNIPKNSPSSPGQAGLPGINESSQLLLYKEEDNFRFRHELYDLGFNMTIDRSDRPWWLKAVFVDSSVMIAQFVAPALLLSYGHTQSYVCYVTLIGLQGLLKGVAQLVTILPPANRGEFCWSFNFSPESLDTIKHGSFSSWFYKPWGTANGCNDMLWSGHTSQTCIGLLFVNNTLRNHNVPLLIRGLVLLYFILYVLSVLMCRMHYSVDVLLASIIAPLLYTHTQLRFSIWWYMNWAVRNPRKAALKASSSSSETQSLTAKEPDEEGPRTFNEGMCCF